MIWALLLIVTLVTVTYAVNTWKIQMITEDRAFCAAGLEGFQALLFIFALIRMIELTDSMVGAAAYVAGAFLGTAGAVVASRRTRGSSDCNCEAPQPSDTRGASPDRSAPRQLSLRRSLRRPAGGRASIERPRRP